MEPGDSPDSCYPNVFVFNPFAEGYIAQGNAFTPVKHQTMLAKDLANLPQFLCAPDDVVLLAKRPSTDFLNSLQEDGFVLPEFVELKEGRIAPTAELCQRTLGGLKPWAWGPDSVKLFAPLFDRVTSETRTANQYFNDGLARLYSKAWSADFLRKLLTRFLGANQPANTWLCSTQEAGVAVDSVEDALATIAAIRRRGHHRVVVKQAHGLAGHNSIRLWEPEILPAQRQWLTRALKDGQQLVVEPWLERELDFSVHLEMGPGGLKLRGYTGLINDLKGQFQANWAEADYSRSLPQKVLGLFPSPAGVSEQFHRLYDEIFALLAQELQLAGFTGPVSIDALVYCTSPRDCRLKPVVEINPRYTMGRLTLELMQHACPGTTGLFRLVNRARAQAEGYTELSSYADSLSARAPLRVEGEQTQDSVTADCKNRSQRAQASLKIRQGALCLNDPGQAQVCLATFEVAPVLNLSGALISRESRPQ